MNLTRRSRRSLAALCICTLAGCGVTPVQKAEVRPPIAIAKGQPATPLAFTKIVTKIPLGDQVGTIQHGWACLPGSSVAWRGGRLNITDEELTDTFRRELESRNYPIVGDPYALFGDPNLSTAEIFIAGQVTKLEMKVCFPFSGSPTLDFGNTSTVRGGTYMGVTWQVFSRKEGKVVREINTEGSYQTEKALSGGFPMILRNAFAANVRNLLADPAFHGLVSGMDGSRSASPTTVTPGGI